MKKLCLRGVVGFLLGVAVGDLITLLISFFVGQGAYVPCVPALTETVGSEIGAVVLQTVLCGFLGVVISFGSGIWEKEEWSLIKQTGIYYLLIFGTMIPVAYLLHWMEHSLWGVLSYIGIFIGVFVCVWVIQYLIWKRRVKKLNAKLK